MVCVCDANPITGGHCGCVSDRHMIVKTRSHSCELRGYDC